ncbi:chain length determinant protein [Streptomyces sp. NPDC048718]|uniref:chain length determinant protein n=1 Tax=Streptomyces sp. NPDC048718 TaxID=3365587 RepID=UPI00371B1517
MDLAEIFRVMRRRWYVLLPGLLLTAGLVVGAWRVLPVSYSSQSTVALLNSRKGAAADGNPFLSMEPSLTGMADSLARNVNSDAAKADLKRAGLTEKYEVKIADNAQGPLLWITVTGHDPAAVLGGNRTLMAFTGKRLQELQADQKVAPDAMIRITTIVPPQKPEAQLKSTIQYLVMGGGLGIVLSLVATFFAEARRRGRGTTTPPRHRQGPGGGDGPAPRAARPEQPGERHALPDQRAPYEQRDQPTVQLPVRPAPGTGPARRPPSWVK